ncbi:MAG TPA: RNA polymerase sigma factor [Candidatus Dormibacteraeota bacterium]|nr:RNA polymerase sigma factor [Candidatus Dormibacteraeota bacterium]
MGATDELLLARCRDGDGEAFGALLERHQAMLYGLAVRILGDRDEAMDALQDACIKAWRAISPHGAGAAGGDHRGGAFRSWMSTIVSRTCIDRLRARRPLTALEDEEGNILPLPDPGPSPEMRSLAGEKARAIEAALRALGADHRAVVLMRDLGGLSYEEIAATLRVPLGTVRSRLARARVQLQGELLRRDPDILETPA